jgi:hypothetical protein
VPGNFRPALFLAASAALIAVALFLHLNAAPQPLPPVFSLSHPPPPQRSGTAQVRAALEPSARRFLRTFLRYEVGDSNQALTRSLRATATPAFAAELLRRPPRSEQRLPPARANLGSLSLIFVSAQPPLVSVSATARRATGPEQLSFVFARHHGRWLASAPGE